MDLYDAAFEHDGCGVACLARLDGQPAHETISRAIETLGNLEHRGAEGADAETGDGAGILDQIPDAFLRAELEFALPDAGRYAVAVCMLPREDERRSAAETVIERLVSDGGQRVLGWRDVPVDVRVPGPGAQAAMPVMRQLLIGSCESDPGATSAASTRRWSTCCSATAPSQDSRRPNTSSPRRASTPSSSAAATRPPTASRPRTASTRPPSPGSTSTRRPREEVPRVDHLAGLPEAPVVDLRS
jgi:hypothetical protein